MDTVSWTREIDEMIREAVARYGSNNWVKVCQKLRSQQITPEQCQHRWETTLRDQTVKGPWSEEEDAILKSLVDKFGPKKWSTIASYINGRIGKQCRERWLNHLSPAVSKDIWTEEEDEILINAQIQMGNKWSYISKLLPGRSENAVKNRYNSIASRNGVRKKRLGNFVNRNPGSRGNLLRLQLPVKGSKGSLSPTESEDMSNTAIDSPYAELLVKATKQISELNAERQRTSLQLPELSTMIGHTEIDNHSTRYYNRQHLDSQSDQSNQSMKQTTDTFFLPNLFHSSQPIDSLETSNLSFGLIDTSDMVLPIQTLPLTTPTNYNRSMNEEDSSLDQIDTFLLSGNTIMASTSTSSESYIQPSIEDPTMFHVFNDNEPSNELSHSTSTTALSSGIAPVRFRPNARMNTLNRGVYSSWDYEGDGGSNQGVQQTHLPQSVSMSMSKQSTIYQSLDLMRLLNEADGGQRMEGNVIDCDNPLWMDLEDMKEPVLYAMEGSNDYFM